MKPNKRNVMSASASIIIIISIVLPIGFFGNEVISSFFLQSNADNPDRDGEYILSWEEESRTMRYEIYETKNSRMNSSWGLDWIYNTSLPLLETHNYSRIIVVEDNIWLYYEGKDHNYIAKYSENLTFTGEFKRLYRDYIDFVKVDNSIYGISGFDLIKFNLNFESIEVISLDSRFFCHGKDKCFLNALGYDGDNIWVLGSNGFAYKLTEKRFWVVGRRNIFPEGLKDRKIISLSFDTKEKCWWLLERGGDLLKYDEYFRYLGGRGLYDLKEENDNPIAIEYKKGTDCLYLLGDFEEEIFKKIYIYKRLDLEEEINYRKIVLDSDVNTYKFENKSDGNYFYLIRSVKRFWTDTMSNIIKVVVKRDPQPFILETPISPNYDGVFNLTWSVSENAKHYSVYRGIDLINSSYEVIAQNVEGCFFTENINKSGVYYYVIKAINEYNSTYSNYVSINISLKPQEFRLQTTADNPDYDGAFNLTWSESKFAENYNIYRKEEYFDNVSGMEPYRQNMTLYTLEESDLNDGTYYYICEAENTYGSILSNLLVINVSNTPKDFSLTSDAGDPDYDGSFLLEWTSSEYAHNYSVYSSKERDDLIKKSNLIAKREGREYSARNFSDGEHFFVVLAINQYGNESSNILGVKVRNIPKEFSVNHSRVSDVGSFNLTWTESKYAENYTIYEYEHYISEINESLNIIEENLKNNSYTIKDRSNGIYYYIVVAYNNYGEKESNCITISVETPPRSFELNINGSDIDIDGNVEIFWSMSGGADNYSVYQYNDLITEINESVALLEPNTQERDYLIEGLEDGSYYYKVVAFNKFGNESSNCVKVVVCNAPKSFELSNESISIKGSFNLTWTESKYAENYTIYEYGHYISEINESLNIIEENLKNNSYTIKDRSNGIYYYIVVAYNNYGERKTQCLEVSLRNIPSSFLLSHNADSPDIDGRYTINWSESFNAINYSVFRSEIFISEINDSVDLIAKGVTSLNLSLFSKRNGDYYYIVVSFNRYGNESSNCIEINVRNAPREFNGSYIGENPNYYGEIDLNWSESLFANNYTIYYGDKDLSINELNKIEGITQRNYTISEISDGEFKFILCAINSFGNYTADEIYVNVTNRPKSFILDYSIPDKRGSFNLTWTRSAYADKYLIYIEDSYISSIDNLTPFNTTTELRYSLINVTKGKYYARVRAVNYVGDIVSNCIEIIVNKTPSEFILKSNAESPDLDGSLRLEWGRSENADNYIVYVSERFISEINESQKILSSTTNLSQYIHNLRTGTYYFVVVAENEFGKSMSNCISVSVENENTEPEVKINPYLMWGLLGSIMVLGIAMGSYGLYKRRLS